MPQDHDVLVDKAIQAMIQASVAVREATVPVWLHLDLTMAQLKAVFALATNGTMTVGELGRSLGLARPGASILVDRLFQLGLVQRAEDHEDRRRTLVYLSPQGQEFDAQLRQGSQARMREWLGRLSDDDLAALIQGLNGLCAAMVGERNGVGKVNQCQN